MSEELLTPIDRSDKDLRDLNHIEEILLHGSVEEMNELKHFHGWSDQETTFKRHYARMRFEIYQRMRDDVNKREAMDVMPSAEELSMGTYNELLEPQVKEAVLMLRKKGYNTYLSGFGAYAYTLQRMMFVEVPELESFEFNEEDRKYFEKLDVGIRVKIGEIEFNPPVLSLDQLKDVWNRIAIALPDLNKQAGDTQLKEAQEFRERFKSRV